MPRKFKARRLKYIPGSGASHSQSAQQTLRDGAESDESEKQPDLPVTLERTETQEPSVENSVQEEPSKSSEQTVATKSETVDNGGVSPVQETAALKTESPKTLEQDAAAMVEEGTVQREESLKAIEQKVLTEHIAVNAFSESPVKGIIERAKSAETAGRELAVEGDTAEDISESSVEESIVKKGQPSDAREVCAEGIKELQSVVQEVEQLCTIRQEVIAKTGAEAIITELFVTEGVVEKREPVKEDGMQEPESRKEEIVTDGAGSVSEVSESSDSRIVTRHVSPEKILPTCNGIKADENVSPSSRSVICSEVLVTLFSGVLAVADKPTRIPFRIPNMDSENGTESHTRSDFGPDTVQEERGKPELEECAEPKGQKEDEEVEVLIKGVHGMDVKVRPEPGSDVVQQVSGVKEELGNRCPSADRILEVISTFTELMDFKYRKKLSVVFTTVTDINQYVANKYGANDCFKLSNVFETAGGIGAMQRDFLEALHESAVHAVVLYARINGFMMLRYIIDKVPFDTSIYTKDSLFAELDFLTSVYDDVRSCASFSDPMCKPLLDSCGFLFDMLLPITDRTIWKLYPNGISRVEMSDKFSDPELLLVKSHHIQRLYDTSLGIISSFDLLTDERYFRPSVYAADKMVELKADIIKYVDIRIQSSYLKLLMNHIKGLSMRELDSLTSSKLDMEVIRKDEPCYDVVQAQKLIRQNYDITKGEEQVARDLCCQIIFYRDNEWFWAEVGRILDQVKSPAFVLLKIFRSLIMVKQYFVGLLDAENGSPISLYYFIRECLMAVPYVEFITRRYAAFVAYLCMEHGSYSRFLGPEIVINDILIPSLSEPIRKVYAAEIIERFLDNDKVEINWSFDYVDGPLEKCEGKDSFTIKVEAVRLIGALFAQYKKPTHDTVHCTSYIYIDSILSKLEIRLSPLVQENPFTENALKYLDEVIAENKISWKSEYYLTTTLLRNLLAVREVKELPDQPIGRPEDPKRSLDERLEWIRELLPIAYAGVPPRPFFSFASLIDGCVSNLDLACALVLDFSYIPQLFFNEFLVLFRILMRSTKDKRYSGLCKHAAWRFGTAADKSLQGMIKWLYATINKVKKSGIVPDEIILYAKHRILDWAEAYLRNTDVLGTDDAKAMLYLVKWKVKEGMKDDRLLQGIESLAHEVGRKSMIPPDDPMVALMIEWKLWMAPKGYCTSGYEVPPATEPRSAVKRIFKPTRLLRKQPVLNYGQSSWASGHMNQFLNETAEYRRVGCAALMQERPESGPGMYGYARPMYVWSINGHKLMPYSAMKNKYEDVPSELTERDLPGRRRRRIPFDLRVEIGSVWEAIPARRRNFGFRPEPKPEPPKSLKRTAIRGSTQSINLPIAQNDIFRIQHSFEHLLPMNAYQHEVSVGISAATISKHEGMQRSKSLPCDLSKLTLSGETIVPRKVLETNMARRRSLRRRQKRMPKDTQESEDSEEEAYDVEPAFPSPECWISQARNITCNYCRKRGHIKRECPLRRGGARQRNIYRTADHSDDLYPQIPRNETDMDIRMIPKRWVIKKQKAMAERQRRDSWGSANEDGNIGG